MEGKECIVDGLYKDVCFVKLDLINLKRTNRINSNEEDQFRSATTTILITTQDLKAFRFYEFHDGNGIIDSIIGEKSFYKGILDSRLLKRGYLV
jgi:hypothetical protein